MLKGRQWGPILARDDTWIIRRVRSIRKRSEDHDRANCERENHRDRNADAITRYRHYLGPGKFPDRRLGVRGQSVRERVYATPERRTRIVGLGN